MSHENAARSFELPFFRECDGMIKVKPNCLDVLGPAKKMALMPSSPVHETALTSRHLGPVH